MTMMTMNQFFHAELQRLYGEEQRLTGLLPGLGRAAASTELKAMLTDYARQTESQVQRLEEVFTSIHEEPSAKRCPRVEGLCTECERMAAMEADPQVRDVALIAISQHLLHDLIASYGCTRAWAKILGQLNAAGLLQTSLDEMKQMDTRFTQVAEKVNREATTLVI
ncbi:MAG: YciE/YciF ferroxidase family protein [Planctomycetota bacterium]|jgi:ferritin-like metal-binding protein YciE